MVQCGRPVFYWYVHSEIMNETEENHYYNETSMSIVLQIISAQFIDQMLLCNRF